MTTAATPATTPATTPAQSEEIQAMLQRLRNSQAFGLPVRWSYYPYCVPPDGARQADLRCGKAPAEQAKEGGQDDASFDDCVKMSRISSKTGSPSAF